jgi:signal transduction histidine kinase
VLVVTSAGAAVCVHFNASELLRRWTASWENFQFDELPLILLILSIGLAWFGARRCREALREVSKRRRMESRLTAALLDNRRLSQQRIELQEAERRTLSRELHDELGQYINVIKIDAVSIRDESTLGRDHISERAQFIVDHCNHVHDAMTRLIRQLRPIGLDELGLGAALKHCVETWRERLPHLKLTHSIPEALDGLQDAHAITLYRLVQEALTNIAKHSMAMRAHVQIERTQPVGASHDVLTVVISDDGHGADLGLSTPGLGLMGMRERIAALSGDFKVLSSPGGGFQLTAQLPVTYESRIEANQRV